MTLISTIGDSVDAVTWNDTEHSIIKLYFGHLIGKYDKSDFETEMNYQNGLETKEGYRACLYIRAICDMLGLSSTSIDNYTKTALNGLQMLGTKHLPHISTDVDGDWFTVGSGRPCGHAYKVAKLLNYLTSKWDDSLAWQEFKAVCDNATKGVLYADPTDNGFKSWDRFYDENAESIEFLLELYMADKAGNAGALTYARDTLWTHIQSLWCSDPDHYGYSPLSCGWECEGGAFAQVIAMLRALNGYTLTNWDRILTDMKARFLNNGWDSPQWGYQGTTFYAIVHHNPDGGGVRLHNTLTSWHVLHAFYQLLDATSQTNMRNLLDGTTKAWEYLLSDSTLYDSPSKKFRMRTGSDLEDPATTLGIILLFMQGIIPQTGGLYSPLYDFEYEGEACLNKYFKFDYANRTIRIPVKAGEIKFIYGTSPVTQDFPCTGIYEIVFASDWDSIESCTFQEFLDDTLLYTEDIPDVGWLSGWNYRKKHTIEQQAGAGTNYQTLIKVYKGSGTDGTEDYYGITMGKMYCDGHCRDDFGDIRFTGPDEKTEWDYWMEAKSDGEWALFWVEIRDNLSDDDVQICVYYDNPTATYTDDYTDQEHGENTWHFFDNFESDLGWRKTSRVSIADGVIRFNCDGSPSQWARRVKSAGYTPNMRMRFKLKSTQKNNYFWAFACADDTQEPDIDPYTEDDFITYRTGDWYYSTLTAVRIYKCVADSCEYCTPNIGPPKDTDWHILEMRKYGSSYWAYWDALNQSGVASGEPDSEKWKDVAFRQNYPCNNGATGRYTEVDWIAEGKFVNPEPAHGSWTEGVTCPCCRDLYIYATPLTKITVNVEGDESTPFYKKCTPKEVVIVTVVTSGKPYTFIKWDDENTDNPRTFTMDRDITRTIEVLTTAGRMNAVKARLMAMIQAYDGTFTVVDELRGNIWDYNVPFASVKIMPSREQKLSFGHQAVQAYGGQYYLYNFTIHVFDEHHSSDQLRAKTVQQYAAGIIKYFRRNNQDAASGIIDIIDMRYRESDPSKGAKRYSRMIISGRVLAVRPWWN